ncbi:hypothetical protein [Bradyrhizobium icense]|uniref:Uncharacterized protein n=1 Tax=Bradyrhizobium icense TaxID=1274631 RepID=A0A1B1UG32_9BRAD|nr:hypothetical protein [Bradyrhizobium icense]ANW01706.1 hypothetical protein LMTR13_17565 [Bradyrhizobium icense]
MSISHLSLVEALNQRLQIVQEVSSAQARSLLNRQLGGGAEFEIQQIEQEIAASGPSHALTKALEDAYERRQRAHVEMAACDAQCVALERRLEELDGWIADGS